MAVSQLPSEQQEVFTTRFAGPSNLFVTTSSREISCADYLGRVEDSTACSVFHVYRADGALAHGDVLDVENATLDKIDSKKHTRWNS